MAFGVTDFEDLVKLLSEHPEWQSRLRPLVLGETLITVPTRLDRVESALLDLTVRMTELTEQVSALTVAVSAICTRMDRIDGRMGNVEGELLELKFHGNMPNWVRQYLRKPTRIFVDDVPELDQATSNGTLSESDIDSIAALDAIVRGLDRESGAETYLAVELSHTINFEDVERADERARLLTRAGLRARALVGGYRILSAAESMLSDRGVLVTLRRLPS